MCSGHEDRGAAINIAPYVADSLDVRPSRSTSVRANDAGPGATPAASNKLSVRHIAAMATSSSETEPPSSCETVDASVDEVVVSDVDDEQEATVRTAVSSRATEIPSRDVSAMPPS